MVFFLAFAPLPVQAQDVARDPARDLEIRATFQRQVPCPSNQRSNGPCPGYEVTYVRPLCSGGSNTVGNLQWQALMPGKPVQPAQADRSAPSITILPCS